MNIKLADSPVSCISFAELDLVGGGKLLQFVVKQKVKHTASEMSSYRMPATQPFGTGCKDGNRLLTKIH